MLENKKRSFTVLTILLAASITLGATISLAKTNDKSASMTELPVNAAALNSGSNRYSKIESYAKVDNKLSLENFTKVMEDDKLEIWHKKRNAAIRIVDKTSGYIWGGLAQDKPEDMNTTWSGIGNSLVSIDYFDSKGIEKRLSIADITVDKKYSVNENVMRYSVNYTEQGIAFDFEMELKNGEVSFRMLDDSIKETKDYSLAAVYFVPFLGCTRSDEIDGYMFVPDGPGALIRYSKPTQYLVNFDKRVYGKDYGIDKLFEVNDLKSSRPNDFTTEEPTVSMPVFGVVQGVKQNALFAKIQKGAEYASIMATPSGMLTNYNWVTGKFIYRQKYLQPTSRSGAGVQIVQKAKNSFEAEITYNFLNGKDADYVGMAKLYRESLRKESILYKKENIDSNIPLQLDVIGSDIEKGFLFNSLLKITTTDQTKSIADSLSQAGINNITMILQGWQKGGIGGNKPFSFEFENKLGGKKSLEALSKYIESKGGRFYYYENPITVNKTQLDTRKEGGNSLSQALIKLERDNNDIWFKDTYFIEAPLAAKYIHVKVDKYAENNMKSMALDEFGSKLYAENQQNHVTTRLEVRKDFEEAAKKAKDKLQAIAFYNPNEYLWKYASEIFDTPTTNSQYLFESDTVPFLQIVLKGSVDYYGPYSNMSFYSRMDILKLVEYGEYPAFLLSGKSNSELRYTTSSELYSTKFEDWRDNIIDSYNYINKALSKVEGKIIIDRTVLSSGVVKVDYEGGISIIVNYTGSDYTLNGVVVPAQDYKVLGGE